MSVNESSANWKLSTPGGIKYKLIEGFPRGSFDEENGEIEEQYVIRANQLAAFVNESFPPVIVLGGFWFFQGKRVCPHHAFLFTKRISFEPLEPGKPCDPYNVHGGLTDTDTYAEHLKITINYSVDEQNNNDDNESFLTVSADNSGEWLVIDAAEDSLWEFCGNLADLQRLAGLPPGEPIEEFQLPASQLVPKTRWNVKWPKFPDTLLAIVIDRCRDAFGKVNSEIMPLFNNAVPDSILFTGFSYTKEYSWKEAPAVSMDMMFEEKFIKDASICQDDVTHQHIYRPGSGFQKLLINDDYLYKTNDHNRLFV